MQSICGYFWVFLFVLAWSCQPTQPVDFSTEVKPILNKECITCHGGVKKQGNFSVLFREEALAQLKSGAYGVIPGHPDSSEMIRRLTLQDPEERMPYEHDALSQDQIDLLTRWVQEGAQWGQHWAYQPVKEVLPPTVNSSWIANDIDRFIAAKARQLGLQVSPAADPATLARRVCLDLIGYPDDGAAVQRFLASPTNENYVDLVDSLLASPHYGEKWTSMWLDLSRYADTKGYERDDSRIIWRYRDWLIRAFNADMPYDQFITEQLAGDLLPHPSEDQYIATAFHRNTMTNDEGGTDNEEFRVAAVIDRVNTTWEALLGTTFACVQCHSHPYDPFRHEDYYRFMAFFNDTRDEDTYDDYPRLRHFDSLQTLQYQQLNAWLNEHVSDTLKQKIDQFVKTWQPAYNSLRCDDFTNAELSDTKWLAMRNHSSARLANVYLGNREKLILRLVLHRPGGTWRIHLDHPSGPVIGTLPLNTLGGRQGWIIHELSVRPVDGHHDLYFTYDNPSLSDPLATGVRFDWFYFTDGFPGSGQPGYREARDQFWTLVNASTETTPIMMDNPSPMHRVTRVFERGSWLSLSDTVAPGTPASLNPFPTGAPVNRLGLAAWMTAPDNPLLSRTLVNRLWEQLFGRGLVETLEDLGSQGAEASHPELLEYLAWQLMHEKGWSMKQLLRQIVLSATYRQDSRISKEQLAADPKNIFLARGPRIRLTAEQIRDQALARCGVLNPEMYGPPVMPYQPEGIWNSPYSGLTWNKSKKNEQYRRALYTYWKRTAPYPSMIAFDGVGREVCTARRIVTNTPLQALVTLNDSVYLDLSRKLADKASREARLKDQQVAQAYTIMTGQPIDEASLQALMDLYEQGIIAYEKSSDLTRHMCGPADSDPAYASLILVANAILNLDEVITKS
ncbi:MAG: DUF1553 domain-containing protein [Saprospiraceae bacterium]